MGNAPYDFVMSHKPADLERLNTFVHRTFFNGQDFIGFINLYTIYSHHGGLETVFCQNQNPFDAK
jgi:hypothetical protein